MLLNYKATIQSDVQHRLLPATFCSIQHQTGSYSSIQLEHSSFLLPTKHKQHPNCCKQTLSHSPWTHKTPIVLLDLATNTKSNTAPEVCKTLYRELKQHYLHYQYFFTDGSKVPIKFVQLLSFSVLN